MSIPAIAPPGMIEGYIVNKGSACPLCKSNQLDTGFPFLERGAVVMAMSCQDCEAQWSEIYTLTAIKDLKV